MVQLLNATNATIANGQAAATITNDDGSSLTISDATLTEGNSGIKNAVFTVTRSGAATSPITVNFATSNGNSNPATAGGDYTSVRGILTFAVNETSKTISVPIIGDTMVEANETFFVNLTAPTNATIIDAQGLGTITNDDVLPSLVINDVMLTEGNSGIKNAVFTVTRSGVATNSITVNFATANGATNPATAGGDYTAQTGRLTFAINETSKTISVPILGDTGLEADETFSVNLSSPTNAIIIDAQGLGTIINDDTTVIRTTGDAGNNVLVGGAGNETFLGAGGSDTLTGGLGADRFRFNSPDDAFDTITDFNPSGGDRIDLFAPGFGNLVWGESETNMALNSRVFSVGIASNSWINSIIYNPSNGIVYFDADSMGPGLQKPLIQLSRGLSLTNQSFVISWV